MHKRVLISAILVLTLLLGGRPTLANEIAKNFTKKIRARIEARIREENQFIEDLRAMQDPGPYPVHGNAFETWEEGKLVKELINNDVKGIVAQYLSAPAERCAAVDRINTQNPWIEHNIRQGMEERQRELVNRYFPRFIELPAVTEADVAQLAGVETSIRVMPRFKAAQTKTSIGLYRMVMGRYPDLGGCFSPHRHFAAQDAEAMASQYRTWDQNPTLPLAYTTSAEDTEFARRLSEITGRNFRIMRSGENEYMRRGRAVVEGQPRGAISTTPYFFGGDQNQVRDYGFIHSNSGGRVHGVHENPPGFDPRRHQYPFGVKQPIGNVWERDATGVLRGGCFGNGEWSAESSLSKEGYVSSRLESIGSRLAEDF